MKCLKNLSVILIIFASYSCNEVYKAGNGAPLLSFEIKTNVSSTTLFKYFDTSFSLNKYKLPEKYAALKKGGDLQYFPNSNIVVYFAKDPEESYHLNSNGVFVLQQIQNSRIGGENWINSKNVFTPVDFIRMEKRIDSFLIDVVRSEKMSRIPDSVIFLRQPYDSIICKLNSR